MFVGSKNSSLFVTVCLEVERAKARNPLIKNPTPTYEDIIEHSAHLKEIFDSVETYDLTKDERLFFSSIKNHKSEMTKIFDMFVARDNTIRSVDQMLRTYLSTLSSS